MRSPDARRPARAAPSLRALVRSLQLPVPLAIFAVLLVVGAVDPALHDFIGHVVAAFGCFLVLAMVASRRSAGSDGYLRHVAFAIPWVALFELSTAFAGLRGPAGAGEPWHAAAFLVQAGVLAVAPFRAERRTTPLRAALPWGVAAALVFAAMLLSPPEAFARVHGLGLDAAAILALFAAGLAGLVLKRRALNAGVLPLLLAAVVATALSFLVHALQGHEGGGALAHAARILGLWLFYVAAALTFRPSLGREDRVYRELFRTSIVGVSLTRPDGAFVAVNPAFARMFGYDSPEQFLAEVRNSAELYAEPAARARVVGPVAESGVARDIEIPMRRRDGEVRWIRGNVVALRDGDGEVSGFQSSVLDLTEERAARERARLEEMRLRRLLEVLPVPVWMLDEAGRVVLRNQAALALWGGAAPEGLDRFDRYRGWWQATGERIAPDGWPIRRALSHGETSLGDLIEIEAFSGERKYVRSSSAPIRDDDGRLIGALAVNEDITDLQREIARRAEQERALREANERFEIVARATNDAVWDWDLVSDAIWWNAGYQALFGYAPQETKPTSESWTDHIHPEDREAVLTSVHSVIDGGGEAWSGQYRFRRRDGSYADVFDRGTVVRVDGVAVRMIGAMMDVSARTRDERALREGEARFRGLVALLSDWYWEQDEELRFTAFQGGEAARLGHDPAGAIGMRRWELPGIAPLSGSWDEHRAVLEARKPFRGFEYSRLTAEGELRYVEASGEPVHDATGRFRGYRGLAKDITDRKRAEQEREKVGRMYASLSALNELVAHAKSSPELLQGACEIAVGSGDFQIAVVRIVEPDGRTASLVASAGPEEAWLPRPLDFHPSSPESQSLSAVAWRTGRPAFASGEALIARPAFARLTADAGTRSAGAYPLRRAGQCIGSLLLSSRDPGAFEGETGALLERMADSVSRGLDAIEAEQALSRFRVALDHSADIIVLVDRTTMRYLDVNETLCRLLGYAREEIVGRPVEDFVTSTREELERGYDALIADPGAASRGTQSHYRCRDGTLIPFESTRRMVRAGDRWIMVAVSRDIRERLAQEEAQRRQEAYFRSLIENVSDAIAVADMDWRFLFASPASTALTGYTPEEFAGRRFGEVSGAGGPDAEAARRRLTEQVAAAAGPLRVRMELRRKDGAVRIIENVISKGTGPGGQPIYVLAGRDVTDRVRAEDELRRREEEFRTLAENAPDGIMRFDATLRCTFANSAIAKGSGERLEDIVGVPLPELPMPPAIRALWLEASRRALATGDTQTREFAFDGPRGKRSYQARFAPERGAGGAVESVLVISRDITDRKRAEEAMAESEERLRSIVQASAEPLLLVDGEGRTIFSNPAADALFGRPPGGLEGTLLGLPLADGRPADVDIVLPAGGVRPAEMQFASTRLGGREVLVVSLHDLSERKRFEEHIQHLANHDALTGLPNRTLLRDRVEQAITHAQRTQGSVALLFVDLDHFKLINDSYGHGIGDALLVEIGERLRATMRQGDTVARLGGDEFVIVLSDLKQPGDAALVARKVAEALGRPVRQAGSDLLVKASIGISLFPGDGDDLDTLLKCADTAMYRAKDSGRDAYQFYSAEMGTQARVRVETEAGLRQAIERNELLLHYQPQVLLADGRITGFEALLRWNQPGRGLVSPGAFIPVAEESGLIVPIGQWALVTACRDAMAWTQAGFGPLKVAVNLSARQFWQGSVTEAVRKALAESGLPAAQLEVEITESVVARDLEHVMRSLEQLRRMGVSVAIDDFGTGYSSLAYLRSLPIQKLKIDKSFIDGIPDDAEATALVSEIVRLAHVLSLDVVAEGVETQAQAALLRSAGCEAMQGYAFSRPLPPAECAALLRAGRRFTFVPEGA